MRYSVISCYIPLYIIGFITIKLIFLNLEIQDIIRLGKVPQWPHMSHGLEVTYVPELHLHILNFRKVLEESM